MTADLASVARRKLRMLDAASRLEDLRSPPANRLNSPIFAKETRKMNDLIDRKDLPSLDLSDTVTNDRIGPVPPGDVLRTEFMEPLGLSARALARDINVPANRITEIINGERAISAETAVLLGFRFATSPEFWLRLQSAHDLETARRITRQKIEELKRENEEQLHAFRNGMHSGENRGGGQVDTTQQDIARLEQWISELDALG